ncbi:hypothetical protein M427DRAFT_352073 [Gonapodya prolifera JEL478]|uniref:Uncharacterized protein n=1 Tax=Gonapodya prolifera (strain JEL478) TaxID=1344416 RepID=A0A139ABP8_GONPJ|nr:hypothetical protein M427DRAFT_352073 [Gonapodya prolifera JEL478]|eukprot:KXS14236.1 hypothetical protein M427DRAFT_352073 [Gonapodya prolifera JEL478]
MTRAGHCKHIRQHSSVLVQYRNYPCTCNANNAGTLANVLRDQIESSQDSLFPWGVRGGLDGPCDSTAWPVILCEHLSSIDKILRITFRVRRQFPQQQSQESTAKCAVSGELAQFLDLLRPLTHPPPATDPAFHVVVPSLIGYGFSSAATGP